MESIRDRPVFRCVPKHLAYRWKIIELPKVAPPELESTVPGTLKVGSRVSWIWGGRLDQPDPMDFQTKPNQNKDEFWAEDV